ncbi:MAG: hypothetical protein Q8L14_04660 [Myxococcales bacterium]|nr:hypothetical protein [Myxococcales bacterium]
MRLLVAALALAYVMPTYSILRRFAGTRDDLTLTSLKVDGSGAVAPAMAREVASALGSTWTSGDLPLTTSLSIKYPGRCRLELSGFESTKTLVVASSNGKKRTEGPEFIAAQVALEELCAFFAVKSGGEGETRAALDRHLTSLKVDTKLVSHARFLGQLAFAIGNRADGNAQYWVYRDRVPPDRFLPARIRFTDERGTWDVRFIDYSSASVADWIPRVVEVYRGEELHLRLTALNADTRADLEKTKF